MRRRRVYGGRAEDAENLKAHRSEYQKRRLVGTNGSELG